MKFFKVNFILLIFIIFLFPSKLIANDMNNAIVMTSTLYNLDFDISIIIKKVDGIFCK